MAIEEYELLKEFIFNRPSGSTEELRALSLVREQIFNLGKQAEILPFDMVDYEVIEANLRSDNKEYTVEGIKGSGSVNGITSQLYFMENSSDQDNFKLKGKIVLIEGSLDYEKYVKLINCKAVAFITYDETITELDNKYLKYGTIPGVKMKKDLARELIKDNPTFITLSLEQRSTFRQGRTLISEIRGFKFPSEIITISTSLDSSKNSIGAYDSGSGIVNSLKLYEYFTINPPKRTIRFLWLGSEKINDMGSRHYLDSLEDEEISRIIFNLSCDKCGLALGKTTINVYAEHALANYISYESKISSYPIHVTSKHNNSSAISFA